MNEQILNLGVNNSREFMNFDGIHWTSSYWNHINRNIGYLKFKEQELLRLTPIAVLGVGGLGGPLAEQLVRSGCEKLVLCDNDVFEESNLNRQTCDRSDLGEMKVKSVKKKLLKINSALHIQTFNSLNEKNVRYIVNSAKVVALTLDDPISSILVARTCRKLKIPVVETWAIPYLCAWWFTPDSVDYESCYELPTHELSIDEMRTSETLRMNVVEALIPKVLKFPGMADMFDRERGMLKKMLARTMPLRSFAPIVRLSASFLAFELIYAGILEVKKKILAPNVIGYDYFRMESINFKLSSDSCRPS